ncbi:hypothetical protein IWZ00DRAFT_546462 [Phyllosticta capitalensis]
METVASLEFERAAAHHVAAASPPPPLPPVSVRPAVSLAARAPSSAHHHHPAASYRTGTSHPSASQESQLSVSSTTSAAPRLLSSQSNVSTDSIPETESTSPATSNVSSHIDLSKTATATANASASAPLQNPVAPNTCITPRKQTALQHDFSPRSAAGSPMAIDTPPTSRGAKRTASGLIKPPTSAYAGNETGASSTAHSRNTSTESGLSRIGKLSAELKTRLSYAMIKVQNGWEQKSIDELETVASQRNSPAVQTPTFARTIASPRGADSRRQSAHSAPDHASPSRGSPLNSISRAYPSSYPNSASRADDRGRPTTSSTTSSNDSSTPSLAPSVSISPKCHRRSTSDRPPPKLGTYQPKPQPQESTTAYPTTPTGKYQGPARPHQRNHSNSPYPQAHQTQTPTTRQGQLPPRSGGIPAGILRMPSQQAEMDAVDSLLFMSSPNNSAHFAQQHNHSSGSMLRPEVSSGSAVKRVAFNEGKRGRGSGYGAAESEKFSEGAGVDVDVEMEMDSEEKLNGDRRESQEKRETRIRDAPGYETKEMKKQEEDKVAKEWASVVGSAPGQKKGSTIPAQHTTQAPVPAPIQVNGRADSASASSG